MKAIFLTIIALVFQVTSVFAGNNDGSLTIPRMVSLRFDMVNARSGPGGNYPIEWIYQQKGIPVEITNAYENWYEIKDWEGAVSWVKENQVMAKRFVKIITPGENNIYNSDSLKSKVIARVEDGAVGEVKKCEKSSGFCLLKFDTIEGWVSKKNIYGIYKNESI